jgi:hypothetical protein
MVLKVCWLLSWDSGEETHKLLLYRRSVSLLSRVVRIVSVSLSDNQEDICLKEAVEIISFANKINFPSSKIFLNILSGLSIL